MSKIYMIRVFLHMAFVNHIEVWLVLAEYKRLQMYCWQIQPYDRPWSQLVRCHWIRHMLRHRRNRMVWRVIWRTQCANFVKRHLYDI